MGVLGGGEVVILDEAETFQKAPRSGVRFVDASVDGVRPALSGGSAEFHVRASPITVPVERSTTAHA